MADVEMTECALSNVDLMSQGTMVQRQIEEATYEKILPKLHNDSVYEFEIKNAEHYIELNKTEVEVKLRIKKGDGNDLVAADKVGLINYPITTLFKDVEITLNEQTITSGSSNYADRAIMEVLLTYNKDAVNSWLQAGGFEYDTAGKMDVADPSAADGNEGLKKRAAYTSASKIVTLRGKLHEDLFNQPKPLPNNNRLYIKFTRNSDKYCLMSSAANADYKIEIVEMALHIRKLKMSSMYSKSMANALVRLPIDRVIQKGFVVTANQSKYTENDFHSGQLPSKVVFGFVDNNAQRGDYKLNPFNFTHSKVEKVQLYRDGQPINSRPISTDFESGDVMDGFWGLARATNTRYSNGGTLITLEDYKLGGYVLWAYDLSPSQCDEEFIDPRREGKLTLEIEFAENVTKALSICIYMQFDAEIKINEVGKTILMYD